MLKNVSATSCTSAFCLRKMPAKINFNKETHVPMTNRVITDPVEQIAFYKSLFDHKSVENSQSSVKGSAELREPEIKEK